MKDEIKKKKFRGESRFNLKRTLFEIRWLVGEGITPMHDTVFVWNASSKRAPGDTRIRNKYHAIDSFDANHGIDYMHHLI